MKRHSRNPFTALAVDPVAVSLEMQERGETIEMIIRSHVVTNLRWVLFVLFAAIVPLIFYSEFGREQLYTQQFIDMVSTKGQIFFIVMWYVIIGSYAVQSAQLWFFNVLIVTDSRIVDLDVTWPSHRKITEAQLRQVQDVSFTQVGFIANIFNYGDIHVQTAGIKQDIEILRVPDPAFIHDQITDLVQSSIQK